MKKIYSRPTLTVHGGATEQTHGKPRGNQDDPLGLLRWGIDS